MSSYNHLTLLGRESCKESLLDEKTHKETANIPVWLRSGEGGGQVDGATDSVTRRRSVDSLAEKIFYPIEHFFRHVFAAQRRCGADGLSVGVQKGSAVWAVA